MSRVLPGDLVSFKRFVRDMQDLPQVQIVEARTNTKKHKPAFFNTAEEAERLAEIRKELAATDPKHLYLVLSASKERAFLMRCDTGRYLVCFTKDIIVHSDEP